MIKKTLSISFIILILFVSSGCFGISMPYNGDIQFHDIALTVPERFICDSTQSEEDLWVFENDNYTEYILILRSDITADVPTILADYVEYMKGNNAESSIVTFLGSDAVLSTYDLDDVYCQEILFPYEDSLYAVALRGGTESGFQEITDSIKIIALSGEAAI